MTKSPSLSPSVWQSSVEFESASFPGVRYRLARLTYAKRLDLLREIRSVGQKLEFVQAGSSIADQVEAALISHEINAVYLRWGLLSIEGLLIDREMATPEILFERGPVALTEEIVEKIQQQCGLTEAERKN